MRRVCGSVCALPIVILSLCSLVLHLPPLALRLWFVSSYSALYPNDKLSILAYWSLHLTLSFPLELGKNGQALSVNWFKFGWNFLVWFGVFLAFAERGLWRWILRLPSYTKFSRCLHLWSPSSWCVWCVPAHITACRAVAGNFRVSESCPLLSSLLLCLLQTMHYPALVMFIKQKHSFHHRLNHESCFPLLWFLYCLLYYTCSSSITKRYHNFLSCSSTDKSLSRWYPGHNFVIFPSF